MHSNLVKPGVIDITSVKNIVCFRLILQMIHCIHIMNRSRRNMNKSRNLSRYIKKCMKLYSSFVFAKLGPPKDAQAKINSSGIKRINLPFNLKIIICLVLSGNGNKVISILLKNLIVAIQVCFCQIASGNTFPKTKMI